MKDLKKQTRILGFDQKNKNINNETTLEVIRQLSILPQN